MDYTTLSTLIEDTVENHEAVFVSHIPDFIQTAERRIYNEVELPVERKNAIGLMTANNKYITLPDDWLATNSLAVIIPATSEQRYLLNKDVEFIRESFPAPGYTGTPTHYAQFDHNTLVVGPTPDAGYSVELHYFAYPTSIVTAGSTWLGDNYPNVLLYGSVREAYIFMKGEQDLIEKYDNLYQEDLNILKSLAEGRNRRDTYRNIQNRVPVT